MFSINPEAKHVIDFKNVFKAFGPKEVLRDVSFHVNKGESLAVIGPSGAGKSTILKLVSNLMEADSGKITLSSNKKGMAFQYSALLNFLSVKENVALPLRKKTSLTEKEITEKVSSALINVGLKGSENLFPQELSGGMQKRVSFARAVVTEPDIILYDEPTSGLDPMTSTMIINDICHIKTELKAAGVIVTHDLETIRKAADKVILLYNGDLVFQGSPKELFNSDNAFATQFANGLCEGPITLCMSNKK